MKRSKLSIQFKFTPALLIIFTLGSFAICQSVDAVVPAPDGGYPGFNTAEGTNALKNLTTGIGNAAVGWYSLFSNTDGSFNTGVGAGTLALNTGGNNTAVGGAALLSNTTGIDNTAVGVTALVSNSTGYLNTATGVNALSGNTVGVANNAFGWGTLLSNTTGTNNNAIGVRALQNNTEGSANVAVGEQVLLNNTNGGGNTAIGFQALFGNNGDTNTAIGYAALLNNTTGVGNTALGAGAGTNVTTAGGVLCLGHIGGNVSNTTWISGVAGVTPQSFTTAPVIVSDGGQLGTVVSSERFKKDIASMDKTSEAILSLRPVTFHYKMDTNGTPQFGLIAEEVGKVNPALVLTDKDGKPYTVRYEAVNAMLLNEFLKEHRTVQEQGQEVQKQAATIAKLQKQIQALTSGLQKVSAEVQMGNPAPSVVLNKH
jgi:hypothetical protein